MILVAWRFRRKSTYVTTRNTDGATFRAWIKKPVSTVPEHSSINLDYNPVSYATMNR